MVYVDYSNTLFFFKKEIFLAGLDSTESRVIALRMASSGLIPNTTYGPASPARSERRARDKLQASLGMTPLQKKI